MLICSFVSEECPSPLPGRKSNTLGLGIWVQYPQPVLRGTAPTKELHSRLDLTAEDTGFKERVNHCVIPSTEETQPIPTTWLSLAPAIQTPSTNEVMTRIWIGLVHSLWGQYHSFIPWLR